MTAFFLKRVVALLFLSVLVTSVYPKVYFVSTTGSDTNTGTKNAPFASVQRAQMAVAAGDTVYIRGGVYTMDDSQIAMYNSIWAYVIYLDKSGTPGKHIKYWAYPGERPIFNFSYVKPANYRINAFEVAGSYIHLRGIEVVGVQVTILTHTQSICFSNQGSNNIFEQLVMRDGKAIGFYMTKGANNLVLNCDAFRNWDDVSGDKRGGNVDGFGFHPAKGGTGNIIRGCRAWLNSDDGYDCINSSESVVFENCWAFLNGFSPSMTNLADGNGFKIGGYGQAPVVSKLPNPIPYNMVRFCLAYRNKANGFYTNHHVETGNYWYNNTAYRNSTNYNMLSQKITTSATTGADTTIDCAGIRHVLNNNISFKYSTQRDTLNIGSSSNLYNSFTPLFGVMVDEADFVSIDESLLTAPRQINGNLPDNGFLRLKQGSDLIDKGRILSYPYNGSAPDLGAFEFKAGQSITFEPLNTKTLGDAPFQLTASASSGLPVSFVSSNSDVAQIMGLTLTISGIGNSIITAFQPGDIHYSAAPEITQTLVVEQLTSIDKAESSILFFPVPVTRQLNISLAGSDVNATITVYSTNGHPLIERSMNGKEGTSIDFSTLKAGVYIVKVSRNNKIEVRRVIKV